MSAYAYNTGWMRYPVPSWRRWWDWSGLDAPQAARWRRWRVAVRSLWTRGVAVVRRLMPANQTRYIKRKKRRWG